MIIIMAVNNEHYINKTFEHDRDKFEKNITLQSRAFLIADEIAKGTPYRQIVAKYMNEWGVSYNYMHSIITESINMFNGDEVYRKMKDINNERLTDIYQEARKNGDLDVAIKAVDKLNKANGVYDDKPVVAVQADDSNIVITFGGQDMNTIQAQMKSKSEDVPFNEVDNLIQNVLDKNEDE